MWLLVYQAIFFISQFGNYLNSFENRCACSPDMSLFISNFRMSLMLREKSPLLVHVLLLFLHVFMRILFFKGHMTIVSLYLLKSVRWLSHCITHILLTVFLINLVLHIWRKVVKCDRLRLPISCAQVLQGVVFSWNLAQNVAGGTNRMTEI